MRATARAEVAASSPERFLLPGERRILAQAVGNLRRQVRCARDEGTCRTRTRKSQRPHVQGDAARPIRRGNRDASFVGRSAALSHCS